MDQHQSSFWLGEWDGGWWLLPLLAILGGAWASDAQSFQRAGLALSLALVLAGWLPLWRALSGTDWVTALRVWRDWEAEAPLSPWPYLQEGTPGAALHRRLRQAVAWWQAWGEPHLGLSVRTVLLSLGLSVLLSLAAGRTVLLLTALFITSSEIALLWDEQGNIPVVFHVLLTVGLPWVLGGSSGGDVGRLAITALALSVALSAFWRGRSSAAALGLLPLLLWLVVLPRPLAAGWVALSSIPLIHLNLLPLDETTYRRRAGFWMALVLILTAGALAWNGA